MKGRWKTDEKKTESRRKGEKQMEKEGEVSIQFPLSRKISYDSQYSMLWSSDIIRS